MKDCSHCHERPAPGEDYEQTACASCHVGDQKAVDRELRREWREVTRSRDFWRNQSAEDPDQD